MEKLRLVLDLIGTVAVLCVIVGKLLPDGKAKEVVSELGFNIGKAIGRAIELKPSDVDKDVE